MLSLTSVSVPKLSVFSGKRRVAVLATGGTIAGAASDTTQTSHYQPGVLEVTHLLKALPKPDLIAGIEAEQMVNIDSKEMNAPLWTALVRRVQDLVKRNDIDGVVITHGTDTLEETAFLLHLSMKSTKPVVLTAAMRPATALSADGPLNLLNALSVAAAPDAAGRGVLLVLNHQIHGARDVTKTHTCAVDAFRSPEAGMLGWVQDGQVEFQYTPQRPHTMNSEFTVAEDRWPVVEIVTSYAGVSRIAVDALVAADVHGIVAAGSGNGSLPACMREALTDARARGIAVVRASRVGSGHVMRNGAEADAELDFVTAGSLNAYKARILLMLALANRFQADSAELQRIFDTY